MIFNLYAIKDELSEYAAPIPLKDDENAKRYFIQIVKENPMMKNNPKDFSIWMVGGYDSETANIASITPKLLERAENFVKED